MGKPKRKLTAAQRAARRKRRETTMIVFINGKQKRVPRPQLIDGLEVDEYIRRNADPIWLHQNGMWEYMPMDDECLSYFTSQRDAEADVEPADCDILDSTDYDVPYPPDWDILDTAEHDMLETAAFDGPELPDYDFSNLDGRDVPF